MDEIKNEQETNNYYGKREKDIDYEYTDFWYKEKLYDSKKAERYFKERGIKYQFIDMKEKGLSKGEFQSVCQAIGGYNKLIDTDCKDKDLLVLITYIAEEDKAEKILENQSIIKVPVVRNGKQATVGYQPEIWKNWNKKCECIYYKR